MFNRKKEEAAAAASANAPKSAPSSSTGKYVDPDDFFKDLDRKSKAQQPDTTKEPLQPKEPAPEVEPPEITGLREEPETAPPSSMTDVETDEKAAYALRDKTAEDDGAYHGNMNDVDPPEKIEIPKPVHAQPKREEAKSAFSDPEDFFKNMGRRNNSPKEPEDEVAPPEITGLREKPEVVPPSSMTNVDTDEVPILNLRDKSADDDGAYYGNMSNV